MSTAACFGVVLRSSDRGKALQTSNDHVVVSAGAVDDEQFSVCAPAANDAHMGIIRVEYQVTGLCVRPRNIGAIAVLCGGSSAVADDIAAAGLIVEHPIHKTAAIHSPPRFKRRIGKMRKLLPHWRKESRPYKSRPCSFWIGTRRCKGSLKRHRPMRNAWPTPENLKLILQSTRCFLLAMKC